MITEVQKLKKDYYENKKSLAELRTRFDGMKMEFDISYEERKNMQPYVNVLFNNYEGDAKIVAVLEKDGLLEEKVKMIGHVIKEYYESAYFYDEVTGVLPVDMIRLEMEKQKFSYISIIDLLHDTRKVSVTMNYEFTRGENWNVAKKSKSNS